MKFYKTKIYDKRFNLIKETDYPAGITQTELTDIYKVSEKYYVIDGYNQIGNLIYSQYEDKKIQYDCDSNGNILYFIYLGIPYHYPKIKKRYTSANRKELEKIIKYILKNNMKDLNLYLKNTGRKSLNKNRYIIIKRIINIFKQK